MSKLSINKGLFVALVLAAFVTIAGCEAAGKSENVESGAQKVATYDGGEITKGELDEQLKLFAQQSGGGEIKPDSPQYDAALAQVMPQLVGLEMAQTYAKENGITVSEKDVDKELETIKGQVAQQAQSQGQNLGKEEAFKQALKQANLTEQQLRDDIRKNLPVQKVQEKVVGDAKPSDKEVEKYYDQNKEAQFSNPERRCAQHILLNKDQKKKAEEVKAQLDDGADFAKLAKDLSQDPGSAEKGGDLGCVGTGETVPEFEKALFGAEEGETVGPVKTEFGYHIIRLNEIQKESVTPLKKVSGDIETQLAQEKQATEFERWIEDQKKQRDLKYLKGYKPKEVPPVAPGVSPESGQPEE